MRNRVACTRTPLASRFELRPSPAIDVPSGAAVVSRIPVGSERITGGANFQLAVGRIGKRDAHATLKREQANTTENVVCIFDSPGAASFSDMLLSMTTQSNPYQPAAAEPEAQRGTGSVRCPVCDQPMSRLRLVFPAAKCKNCRHRIRMRSSWRASSLSTITGAICLLSLVYFDATIGHNSPIFAIHAVVFVVLGTFWFHLFGNPALAGWFGYASQSTLERERLKYRNRMNTPRE
ncbi:hypothetical protein [Allorhodopirellula solitaria]|uniref:Uncharacterized protein n=1 Tax=Allorhodopirellula solitaria TaxID=2527987 RepID=A0A5C5WZY4_9BACT|nr:hypothetical protein [Allorhodopirellula solitaria]TWT56246.1 hypothetical protein CA85_44280 [Allorhodopirellula solitaria]